MVVTKLVTVVPLEIRWSLWIYRSFGQRLRSNCCLQTRSCLLSIQTDTLSCQKVNYQIWYKFWRLYIMYYVHCSCVNSSSFKMQGYIDLMVDESMARKKRYHRKDYFKYMLYDDYIIFILILFTELWICRWHSVIKNINKRWSRG